MWRLGCALPNNAKVITPPTPVIFIQVQSPIPKQIRLRIIYGSGISDFINVQSNTLTVSNFAGDNFFEEKYPPEEFALKHFKPSVEGN